MRSFALSYFATGAFLLMPFGSSVGLADPAVCIEFYKPEVKSLVDTLKIRRNNARRLIRLENGHAAFIPFLLGEYVRSYKLPAQKNELSHVLEGQKVTSNRDKIAETARRHLDANGVLFKEINSQMYKGTLETAPAGYLRAMEIRSSSRRDAHPLNLLANVFQHLLGVSLVYDQKEKPSLFASFPGFYIDLKKSF